MLTVRVKGRREGGEMAFALVLQFVYEVEEEKKEKQWHAEQKQGTRAFTRLR